MEIVTFSFNKGKLGKSKLEIEKDSAGNLVTLHLGHQLQNFYVSLNSHECFSVPNNKCPLVCDIVTETKRIIGIVELNKRRGYFWRKKRC